MDLFIFIKKQIDNSKFILTFAFYTIYIIIYSHKHK